MNICDKCGKESEFCSGVCHHYKDGSARKGKKLSIETKNKISNGNKGKKYSEESLIKMSMAQRGAKSSSWKGGITPEKRKIRNSLEWGNWRGKVFERDNYVCQRCSQRGGKLRPHHIKSFCKIYKKYIKIYGINNITEPWRIYKLFWDINNGITMCKKCHGKFHNIYGYNNNKKQIMEFIK